MARRALGILVVLIAAKAGAGLAAAGTARVVVTSVEVKADSRIDRAELLHVLGITPGEPLDRLRLRQGIRALYAGGNVESLEIESAPAEGGIALFVTMRLRPRVSRVAITGVGLLWRFRIRSWIRVHHGDAFSTSAVQVSARRIRRELVRRAFLSAVVEPDVDYDPATNTAAVTFAVDLGPRARAAGIELVGFEDTEGKIAAAARLKPGKKLTTSRLDRVRDRIEAALRRHGYWEAEVIDATERPAENGYAVIVRVDPGPRYRLDLRVPEGQKKVARRAMPGASAGPTHPAQTKAVAAQVRVALQSAGYLLARVEASLDQEQKPPVLVVAVDTGPRCRVAEVAFPGNTVLPARKLRRAVAVHRGKLGGAFGQTVNDQTLDDDRTALVALFHRSGFAEARVGPAGLEDLGGGRVRVSFPVHPGRRWVVDTVRFVGFPVAVAPVLESPDLPVREGRPWNPDALEAARRRLVLALQNHGYPDAEVRAAADTHRPGHAAVTLTAEPGEFVTLSEVVISGLYITRESVVRGVLDRAGLATGAPYSLDNVLTAQRKLYELGIFRQVDITPIPGQERGPKRGLVVHCTEGLQRSLLFGAGWDTTNKAHVTIGWSHLNLFGGAHALNLQTRLSSREKTYRATLREPNVPWLNVPAYASVYRTFEDFTSFSQTRRGLWIDLGDRRKRPFRLWWRYQYQIIEPEAPPEILSDLERENQRARIASIAPTVEIDTRNDPFLPTKGFYAAFSAQYAFPMINADARFLKTRANFSLYGHVPGGTGALGVRLGAIFPIAARDGGPENLQVPIGVRFFAGGSASNRAFATDELGIPGQTLDPNGDPIGGNALVLLNLEYRRKIRGPFSAVLFVDGGNVWAAPSRVSFNDMRWGVGLGLRVDTPAGPLRLDYGRKIHRRHGESAGELFLAFGIPF